MINLSIYTLPDRKIFFSFRGEDEPTSSYTLTPERLFQILEEREDITLKELE